MSVGVAVGVAVLVEVAVAVGVKTRHEPVGAHHASTIKAPGVQSVPDGTSAQ